MERREFLRIVGRGAVATGIGTAYLAGGTTALYTGFAAGTAATAWYETKDLPYKSEGLAILISYGTLRLTEDLLSYPAKLLVPLYVGSVENAFGQRADAVVTGATRQDFYDALDNSGIHNIVLFGHGKWDSWYATDGMVTALDLHQRSPHRKSRLVMALEKSGYIKPSDIRRKRGYLLRHTCGLEKLVDIPYFQIERVDIMQVRSDIAKLNAKLRQIPGPLQLSLSLSTSYKTQAEARLNEYSGFQLSYSFRFRDQNNLPLHQNPHLEEAIVINKPDDLTYALLRIGYKVKDIPGENFRDMAVPVRDVLVRLKRVLLKGYRKTGWKSEVLGTPYFAPEKILGWSERTTPLDFLVNPFGKEDGNS